MLERFPAKHALGLDPGVDTGSREENASKQETELRSDSIGTEKALGLCLSMIFSENRFPLFRIML
jgi:hypothetical protein